MGDFKPRPVGVLIDDAIELYRANARPILLAALVGVLPAALLVGLGQEFYFRGFLEAMASGSNDFTGLPTFEVFLAYAATNLGLWLMLFGRTYLDVTVLAAAPQMLFGRVADTKAFLKGGLRRYGWYLLTSWLVQIVAQIAAIVSFFALFAGGVVLWVLLALAAPITVLERANVADGVRRSYELVKPHFWRAVRFLLLLTVLTGLFEGAIASPLIVRQVIVVAQNPEAIFHQTPLGWKIVEGILLAAAITFVSPIASLGLFTLYVDLRERAEGMDLIIRARRLAAQRA